MAESASKQMTKQLKVTQVRSGIGGTHRQRESLKTLGLRKIRQSVVREDSPSVRGLIATVHHLRPAPGAKKAKTRVGRGEASKGKTAGRGTKGTKARYQVRPGFEGGQMPLHMRLPKLRGFRNPNRVEFQPVNVGRIAELFPEGGTVTVEDLVAKGAVRKNQLVKVLGGGDVTVALTLTVDAWSGSAKEKIEAAGGSIATR